MLTMPDLLEFDGEWTSYIDNVYQEFQDSFLNSGIRFRGLPVRPRYTPEYDNKEFGFWHLTSEGEIESERTPDLKRCARIRWITHMIRNNEHECLSCWEERRGNSIEVVIWNEFEDYVVVLAERHDYWLLKTAYLVTRSGKRRQLESSRTRNQRPR
ncbi:MULTISPECIES: oxidoreductase [Klebsiella]|nr:MULTISPECIES: oxidoreductase [Klebsiella]HDT3046235.1 oxidoreductase [Klebsiella pneumoniae subsp. ozaenae]EIV2282512.1 oxidoreductase [Klebsiella pneumoniae]EIX9780427.1 oxidoreductase [Klebsiella pneumoniae]EKL1157079.1 oxidoreductase [Klebsiella pneumoniae]EKV0305193.1 oxidoreductase [Klebsiella pneumoniae]